MQDRLGFGPLFADIEPMNLGWGRIQPVLDPGEREALKAEVVHHDGFVHPPIESWHTLQPDGSWVEVRPSKRKSSSRFQVKMATHELVVLDEVLLANRRTLASVLIQLIGMCFDVRLQFSDWWEFDPKPVEVRRLFFSRPEELQQALCQAIATAARLSIEHQTQLLAALAMHTRVPGFSHDWQKFAFSYASVDACRRLLQALGKPSKPIELGLPSPPRRSGSHTAGKDRIGQLATLRNALLHQALVDSIRKDCETGNPSGVGAVPDLDTGTEMAHGLWDLRRLFARLVMHILDVDCTFRTSNWTEVDGGVPRLGLAAYQWPTGGETSVRLTTWVTR